MSMKLFILLLGGWREEIELQRIIITLHVDKNWLSKVDLKKNPCEDFYGFTCGKYTDTTTEIDNVVLKVKKQLYKILKSPITKSDHKGLKMAKQMFSTCVKHGGQNYSDFAKRLS